MTASPFDQACPPSWAGPPPGSEVVRKVKVAVIGGGNGAKAAAAMAGHCAAKVDLYFSPKYADRAAALADAIKRNGGLLLHTKFDENGKGDSAVKSNVSVTTDVACVAAADIVIVSLPAPSREQAVMEIGPHLKSQLVVFLPGGSGGVDLSLLRAALGARAEAAFASGLIYAASKTLPWATRECAPGEMRVGGTKARLETVVFPSTAANRFTATGLLSMLHGHPAATTAFFASEHWLEATHFPYNYLGAALLHPGILYGYWANWDGEPLEQAPLFYHDITELATQTLQGMWEELWATSEALAAALGLEEPPSPLRRIMSAMMERYGAVVGDASTLLSGFRTNGAYAGFFHAMQKDPASGKLLPNFNTRYLFEDLPYGLCAFRGIAEICKVPTPTIDKVLTWGQEKIGKSYLVNGRLEGPDVAQSGAPQRWGIKRPADLLVWVPSDVVVTNMEALASAASASFGAASDALLQQLGSLALPSLAEEEEEEGNGASAAAGAKPKLTAQSSRSSLLARRLSQRLLSHGAQSLRLPPPANP